MLTGVWGLPVFPKRMKPQTVERILVLDTGTPRFKKGDIAGIVDQVKKYKLRDCLSWTSRRRSNRFKKK